ncbi:MAG TPA: carboxy terminal-processing peptidase, partial [Lacipirellulaceae bacterium]|nr:carboxy terminal-processing peptidase [Lacipirellulaceae bacterium]
MNFVACGVRIVRRRTFVAVVGVMAVTAGIVAPLVLARPTAPTPDESRISLLVAAMMDRKHLSRMRLDDEISARALKMFFETLDPMKLYFYKSDIDEFRAESTRLDDYVKAGDVRIANRIFDRFYERVIERTAVAQALVDAEHDFTVDESMDRDPKKIEWMTTREEADERWRKRVKYDLLLQVSDDVEDAEAKEKLHKRYRSISQRWEQTDNDELLEMFLSAVTMSFDPHSSYMSPRSLGDFVIQMKLELDGIGASLESKYGETVVRHIVPGGAAAKDGRLKVEDVITGVGQGENGEIVDITDVKLTEVVSQIRGTPNSVVRLEVKTAGGTGRQIYAITRARIELKDSEARSEVLERGPHGEDLSPEAKKDGAAADETASGNVVEQSRADGSVFRIGVIGLPSFYMDMDGRRQGRQDYKSTTRDVRRLLEGFKQQNVDLVVVDLRFNGGGSLPEAVDTTGLFIDQGPVVQVKGPDGRTQPYPDQEPGQVWSGPLVVLINKFSASASEIFAGAIQDYGRGIVIGDRATHGKGTVQQLEELGAVIRPLDPPNYGALKMTIQQFYRPGGDSTQNRGVVSDIELPSQMSHWEGIGEADLDFALKFDRVLPLAHDNYRDAGATVIEELRRRSAERVKTSEYFIAEQRRILSYQERMKNPTIPLNKEKFLAE